MSYNSDLVNDTRALSNSQTRQELLDQMIAGDTSARDQLIINSVALVNWNVNFFLRKWPKLSYMRDDMTSDCLIELTKAVNNLAEGRQTILSTIDGFIKRVITNTLYHSSLALNNEPDPEKTCDFSKRSLSFCSSNSIESVDLMDELAACCLTPTDRNIVDLRREGYTFEAIAKLCNTNYSAVYSAFQTIEERFDQRNRDND